MIEALKIEAFTRKDVEVGKLYNSSLRFRLRLSERPFDFIKAILYKLQLICAESYPVASARRIFKLGNYEKVFSGNVCHILSYMQLELLSFNVLIVLHHKLYL